MSVSCTRLAASYDGGEDLWEGLFTALTRRSAVPARGSASKHCPGIRMPLLPGAA